MRNTLSLAAALVLVAAAGLALCGCHTSHDIHITLDIRYIESSVADPQGGKTRAVASGQMLVGQKASLVQISEAEKTAVENRRARLSQVLALKAAGNIGENNQGFLAIPPSVRQRLTTEEKSQAAQAIDAENRDRGSIYQSVARRYSLEAPLLEPGGYWAEEFRSRAKPGEWVQVPQEPAFFSAFLASPLGQCLSPAARVKGQWVRVPARYQPPEQK